MDTEEYRLLPCPMCENTNIKLRKYKGGKYKIICLDCGVNGKHAGQPYNASTYWNNMPRRAQAEVLRSQLSKKKEETKKLEERVDKANNWSKEFMEIVGESTLGIAMSTLKAKWAMLQVLYRELGSDPLKDLLNTIKTLRTTEGSSQVYNALNTVFIELRTAREQKNEYRDRATEAELELGVEKERVWKLVKANDDLIQSMATVASARGETWSQ